MYSVTVEVYEVVYSSQYIPKDVQCRMMPSVFFNDKNHYLDHIDDNFFKPSKQYENILNKIP